MFCYTDSASGASSAATGAGDPCFWEYSSISTQYKDEVEECLWMLIERREWREHLKAQWLKVLRMKQYFNAMQFSKCMLYYRRLLFPISGWLGRKGRNKKN